MLSARFLAFTIAFVVGVGISYSIQDLRSESETRMRSATNEAIDHSRHPGLYSSSGSESKIAPGTGSASCGIPRSPLTDHLPGEEVKSENNSAREAEKPWRITKPLRVIHKEKASYTAEARTKGIEGTVTLRVTFLASGGIGAITTLRGLPFGLTEQAIEAARKMRFEPERSDKGPRTTSRPVSFTFNLY
jgi:TonB family protein